MAESAAQLAKQAMTKRSLITISHAIEQAAVAAVATQDEPVVLIALFQRPLYFDRERAAYRKLSKTASLTIVGVVDTEPDVPPGVEGVALDPREELAAEWSVIMLTPRAGAALVAVDQERIIPGETTIEKGRVFDGWWSFHRVDAQAQVARLRDLLGDRLSKRALTIIDDVLDEANNRRSYSSEERTSAALQLFVDHMEKANRRIRELERYTDHTTAELDQLTGLKNSVFLNRWVGAAAHTASDTLRMTVVMLDVNRLRDVNEWYGRHVGDEVLKRVADIISEPLRDVDHAVRVEDDDFLVLLPHLSLEQGTRLAYRLCAEVATLRLYDVDRAPGVTATAVVTSTRERPLPLRAMKDALAYGKQAALSVTVLETPDMNDEPGAQAGGRTTGQADGQAHARHGQADGQPAEVLTLPTRTPGANLPVALPGNDPAEVPLFADR